MAQKLVSVIIPTFNRAELVIKAIQSLKAQTYKAVQIIVIDDGSQDNTAQVVAEFEDIEYYYQENKGQGAARNLGLKYVKGEYFASLDSDDTWNENFLETAVAAIEKYETDFVFLNWMQIFQGKEHRSDWQRSDLCRKFAKNPEGEWFLLDPKKTRDLFIRTCPAPSSAILIRRSSLQSTWNEKMKIADDWYLILEMVLTKPCRAAFTLSVYWTKQVHSSNIYHGRDILEITKDLGLHDEPLIAKNFDRHLTFREKVFLKKRLSNHYFNYGRLSWRRNGFSRGSLEFIFSAFRLAPVGSLFYILQLSFHSLKNRRRIAKNK